MSIILKEHQVNHVERLVEILDESNSAFDMSTMGMGKTYTTIECCKRRGLKNLVVVCPVSMEKKWKELSNRNGFKTVIVTSFAGLRSSGGRQPKHGLLKRISVEGEEFFEGSDKFLDLVGDGVMFVVDEVHNLKNNSEQFKACKTLTEVINGDLETRSRIMLLSGTPVDKEEQTIRMLRLMGLIGGKRLATYIQNEKTVEFSGAVDLVNRCREKDPKRVSEILRDNPTKNTLEVVRVCHILFRDVVRNVWVSKMPPPISEFEIDAKNLYCNVRDEKTLTHLQYYIEQLHKNSGFTVSVTNVEGGGCETVNIEGGKLGAIVKCLEGIEQSKMTIFERLVRTTLQQIPNAKICVGLNYVQRTLLNLADRLKDLNPALITGETPKRVRDGIVERFQKPDLESRLIIANIRCLSTGIDLDDKTGNFPRFVFASPNYTIVDLHQFSRRFIRVDSKSSPVFRFVYGKCGRKEKSILNALARKSKIMHEILGETDRGVRFPGEYEDEFEHEDE